MSTVGGGGEGIDALLEALKGYAFESPHFFPDDALTDQPERVIAAELIREKLLLSLQHEVPHGIAVVIESWHERETTAGDPIVDAEATIYCERESHKGIVIGKRGAMLQKIGTAARKDLEEMLGVRVNLQCWVKVREDWRNREKWPAYEAAVNEMLIRTSTDYAPWTVVEANSKYYARIKVLKTVINAIEKAIK